MILFKEAGTLSEYLNQQRQEGKSIGFVPTMGALHPGHLSLIKKSKNDADLTVCSIFVNPTQFNNADDFQKYPITVEKDIEQLTTTGCDVLFLPSVNEIYPPSYHARHYELGTLETVLEGHFRPGHFQGVCQVVDRLLEIVNPSFLYLGQKDYQQCQVVQQLLQQTGRTSITLVIAPTIREKDGLAMSSRNLRLSEEQRAKAPAIYEALRIAQEKFHTVPVAQIQQDASEQLTTKGFRVDYFEIVDATTLLPLNGDAQPAVAVVAAYLDDIRLIDNLPVN
jgi:pantoate--beta-alanine ligase